MWPASTALQASHWNLVGTQVVRLTHIYWIRNRELIPRQIDKSRVPKEQKGIWGSWSGDWGSGILKEEKRTIFFFPLYIPAAAAAKSLQLCPTLCDPTDGSPPGSPVPGTLQARTLAGCHFLLQCVKVKSESEVTQSCPTPSDPMDCSLPGFWVHGILQARVLESGAIATFLSLSQLHNSV